MNRAAGAGTIVTMWLVVGLFPVYYNVLSQFVSRRDELVLKRMRTGETRDSELLASIALPGAICALVAQRGRGRGRGRPRPAVPVEPAALRRRGGDGVVMFTAFAYWTAAWTKNAEAAQLTSLPIIILASVGPLTHHLPDMPD